MRKFPSLWCCYAKTAIACVDEKKVVVNHVQLGQFVVLKREDQLRDQFHVLCDHEQDGVFDVSNLLLQGVMGIVQQRSMGVNFVDKGSAPFQNKMPELERCFSAVWTSNSSSGRRFQKIVDDALAKYMSSLNDLICALPGEQNQLELRLDLIWFFKQMRSHGLLTKRPNFNTVINLLVSQFSKTIVDDDTMREECKRNFLLPAELERSCVSLRC